MVAKNARLKAAEVIADLRDGRISNFDFEDRWPSGGKSDRALGAILSMLWRYYDDTLEHKLSGDRVLSETGRRIFDRCILFLNSDLEYQWEVDDFYRGGLRAPATLGLSDAADRMEYQRLAGLKVVGPEAVWPFFDKTEYESAVEKQKSSG